MFYIPYLVLAGAVATRADFSDGVLSEQEKVELLDYHNFFRSETALGNTGDEPAAKNMVKLVWDESLAKSSKAHAKKCVWEHSGPGENLAASASSANDLSFDTLKGGIANWYIEHEDHNFAEDKCAGVCGHYTQVVWAETVKLGCAYQMCGPGFAWDETYPYQSYLVCQYDPPGNYDGQLPYLEAASDGDIASECPDDYVSDENTGLCSMASTPKTPTKAPKTRKTPTKAPKTRKTPTKAPTSSSVACESLSKKKCKKEKTCAFGPKEFETCSPKTKYEHDCSQYASKKKCNKTDFCKYSKGDDICMHKCYQATKKSKCKKATKGKTKNKICDYEKMVNPCKGCNPITCSS